MLILLFTIFALIMSAILHEYAHGWVAYKLGDYTAKDAGRLTLNPMAHLDLFGSIILPLLLILSKTGFILGWAKPVPYNPYNLRDQKYGDLKVALGGPGTNFLLAILFGLAARLTPLSAMLKQNLIINYFSGNHDFLLNQMQGSMIVSVFVLSIIVVFINLLLMIFNLMPIPPLDGSKVLMTFLSADWKAKFHKIEPYGIFIILFLLMFGFFSLIWPVLLFLFGLIVGV
ncbi:site-2 protease family protein [Candidatus Parcubacteria bacterium]|nr:site-2 protease family protein [Candidatus Parcubacteria bacterium]